MKEKLKLKIQQKGNGNLNKLIFKSEFFFLPLAVMLFVNFMKSQKNILMRLFAMMIVIYVIWVKFVWTTSGRGGIESKLKTKMQFTRCKQAHCARNVNKVVRMTIVASIAACSYYLCIWLYSFDVALHRNVPKRDKSVSIWFDAERKTVWNFFLSIDTLALMFIVIHFYDFHHINVITWNFR